jgi:hypothetical protein
VYPGRSHVWDYEGQTSPCAGDEVHGVLEADVTQFGTNGEVEVKNILGLLYEGSSCYSDDRDGYNYAPYKAVLRNGESATGSFTVRNTDEGSGDKVQISYRIDNVVVG